ncbi:oligogalacturonate-specific porin KdgM family protein [Celerinatantimonas yamalensis]|uniref:Oligogalacturonate-specific porin KdgM family protein n=1 Tax=Celerinatantimonas yamalensis TaxID=559956 RepID=A0ABW9G7J8_9GAMM
MKLFKLSILPIIGLSIMSHAYATTLSYDHEYEDVSQAHTDELSISHQFDFGLGTSATLKFTPNDKPNGDSGSAFQDDRWDETKIGLNYPIALSHDWSIIPGVSLSRKHDEYKYKPYLKAKYKITPQLTLSARYRREMTHYTLGKKTKLQNRYDAGASYKINAFKLSYTFTYYQANTIIFNHEKHDYEHKIDISYKLSKHWSPFVEFKNEAVSSKLSDRQTEYKVGIDYKF